MSKMHLPAAFVRDFQIWEAYLREDGETDAGIAEIKQAIRDAWSNLEMRNLWQDYVSKFADSMPSGGINQRIRE